MKTTECQPITTAQIKKIHTLLNKQGLLDEKRTIVYSVTSGRTDSTKELTLNEAKQLINLLLDNDNSQEKRQQVFKAIYGLAWKMEIVYGTTDEDYQMNLAKLNVFCRERGTVKKNLTEQTLKEMYRTRRQFEAMYSKYNK